MRLELLGCQDGSWRFQLEFTESELGHIEEALSLRIESEKAPKPPVVTEDIAPFVLKNYKALPIQERTADAIYDHLIAHNSIPLTDCDIESEVECRIMGYMQKLKYQMLFGGGVPEMPDKESLAEDVRQQVIREEKIRKIQLQVIALEGLCVTDAELLRAAEDLAAREGATVEMIKQFMGENLDMLRSDVLRQKAEQFLLDYNT